MYALTQERRAVLLLVAWVALVGVVGCASRVAETAPAASFRLLTYNIDKEASAPDATVETIRAADCDIVCLQETTPQWETILRGALSAQYPYMEFHSTSSRRFSGLGILSKLPGRDVAYIPSDTTWYDGWIRRFETAAGPVQILNVHLHPPVSEEGHSTPAGILFTADARLHEFQHYYSKAAPSLPLVIAGDFNDDDASSVLRWSRDQGLTDALGEFDLWTNTWHFAKLPVVRRRLDHILYGAGLYCYETRVVTSGSSDHWPLRAVFGKPKPAATSATSGTAAAMVR